MSPPQSGDANDHVGITQWHNVMLTHTKQREHEPPAIVMTYVALLMLSILKDDFSRLERSRLISFLRACQHDDGSFTSVPGEGDADLRMTYCAFAISKMMNDWSGVDVPRALLYIRSCRVSWRERW